MNLQRPSPSVTQASATVDVQTSVIEARRIDFYQVILPRRQTQIPVFVSFELHSPTSPRSPAIMVSRPRDTESQLSVASYDTCQRQEAPAESQVSLASYDALKTDTVGKTFSVAEVEPARVIPNGGTQAWLQVLGAFFLYFNTWGESAVHRSRKQPWSWSMTPIRLQHTSRT